MILTFLLHESATTYQINSNLVSQLKLNALQLKILKTEKLDKCLLHSSHAKQRACVLDTQHNGTFFEALYHAISIHQEDRHTAFRFSK